MMSINNKLILIVGGARMGKTLAEKLTGPDTHIILTYRSSKKSINKSVDAIKSLGGSANAIRLDATNEKSVKNLMTIIQKKWHRLDVLINMTSIYESTPFSEIKPLQWERILSSNLRSGFLLVQLAASLLKKSKGRVIHFSDWVSASGRPRYKNFMPYYTAKKAVIGLAEAQALELAPSVLVNVIAPGPILPPKTISNEETRSINKVTPLGRWGGPKEIAKAVQFLIETDFVTGECIRVDGGRHLF